MARDVFTEVHAHCQTRDLGRHLSAADLELEGSVAGQQVAGRARVERNQALRGRASEKRRRMAEGSVRRSVERGSTPEELLVTRRRQRDLQAVGPVELAGCARAPCPRLRADLPERICVRAVSADERVVYNRIVVAIDVLRVLDRAG